MSNELPRCWFLKQLLRQMHGWFWETYLRVDTRGRVESLVAGGVHYSPLPYNAIFRILDHLDLSSHDVLVDLGCGKGRILAVACRRRILRAVGIEANSGLLEVARHNLERLPGRQSKFELIHLLAQEYQFPDATAIVMYNPFDEFTMGQVCSIVNDSFRRNPRRLRIAYANCAYEAPLRQLAWLKRVEEWPSGHVTAFTHRVSFWESVA